MCRVKIYFKIMIIIFFGHIALSATNEYPLSNTEKLIIEGMDLQINILSNTNLKTIRVTMDEFASSTYVAYLQGKEFIIKPKLDTKSDYQALSQVNKKAVIDIQMPSVLLDISMRDGQITLQKWTKEVNILGQKMKTTLLSNSSLIKLSQNRGEVVLNDSSGKFKLDAYLVSLTVKNFQGDLDIQNLSGDSILDKTQGVINYLSHQGSLKLNAGGGNLNFDSQRGNLSSQQFSGRLDVSTSEGLVNVVMVEDQEVHVKSQSGKVTVTVPSNGARLNLATAEGEMVLPSTLKPNKEGHSKSFKGVYKSEGEKNSVFVRNSEGSILIK